MTEAPIAGSVTLDAADAAGDSARFGRPDTPLSSAQAPVTTLRGAGVDANIRTIGGVLAGLSMATLAALTVVFFVAGVHKNDQINRLHHEGVSVKITITGCTGLLGGSGSNAAGYSCRGEFVLDGARYEEPIPGNVLHPPGATLDGIAVPGDPALVSTVGELASEHASWNVFVVPSALLVVLVGAIATVPIVRRRRSIS